MNEQQIKRSNSYPPLIYTEQRRVPKVIDYLLTLIAWAGFIWLIYLGVWSTLASEWQTSGEGGGLTLIKLSLYLCIAALNACLLILWAKYNQRRFCRERRTRTEALPSESLSQHFGLSVDTLAQLSQARIAVVHHNIDGTALKLEVRGELTPFTRQAS